MAKKHPMFSVIRDIYPIFGKGLTSENPTFRQMLGMCPTLAITTAAINGLAMGLATTFALVSSCVAVSIFRRIIPAEVRIATYVVIIATFVTVADLVLAAFFPDLSKALGPYVPLIVVNCIILGRQEAFASRNGVFASLLDSLGMGTGFMLALLLLGSIRELLGNGTVFDWPIFGGWFSPWLVMILPPGAFFVLGLLIATSNYWQQRKGLARG